MKLNLESLQKALSTLERAIEASKSDPTNEYIRDAVILRFLYSWELSWKMIKRRLVEDMPTPSDADELNYPNLIREGAERGIVSDVELWMEYRKKCNTVSDGYDQNKARETYEAALEFYIDSADLLNELEKRNQ